MRPERSQDVINKLIQSINTLVPEDLPLMYGEYDIAVIRRLSRILATQRQSNSKKLEKIKVLFDDPELFMVSRAGRDTMHCIMGRPHRLNSVFFREADHLAYFRGYLDTAIAIAVEEEAQRDASHNDITPNHCASVTCTIQ